MKIKTIAASLFAAIMLFSSCQRTMPTNPRDRQEWRDSNGNSWVYDAMMARWMLGGGMGGYGGPSYYYYPSTGSYSNHSGVKVTPPASVTSGIKSQSTNTTKSTVNNNSTSSKSSTVDSKSSSTSSTTKSRSSFGSTGRSSSSTSGS